MANLAMRAALLTLAMATSASSEACEVREYFEDSVEELQAQLASRGYALSRTRDGDVLSALDSGLDAVLPAHAPFYYDGGYFSRSIIGGRGVYDVGPSNANLTLAPHNEMGYSPRTPRYIAFGAKRAAEQGGDTTLLDGHALLSGLDGRWRLDKKLVRYRVRFDDAPHSQTSWRTAFNQTTAEAAAATAHSVGYHQVSVDSAGSVRAIFDAPAVLEHPLTARPVLFDALIGAHGTALDDEPTESHLPLAERLHHTTWAPLGVDDGEIELATEFLAELKHLSDELTITLQVPTGHVLIVDNIWHKHGRTKFSGNDRNMLVAMRGAFRGDLGTSPA